LAGVRCAGTAEFAGLDATPDYRRAKIFIKLAKKLFPAVNADDAIEWMGTRPSFPDSLPCLGQIPGHANIFSAFGHSHYGFGMAPNTGRVMAQLLSGETPNINLSPYQIERFQ
jgi:D-amino-acid dehydrogenase